MGSDMAPMAELSTRDVQPFTKGTIMAAKIATGRIPARNSRSFSARGTLRSLGSKAGPSCGCKRQRTTMYRMNIAAIINPGTTPASHNWPTGWRAIIAYRTNTTEGGIRIPSEEPAWITPVTICLS